jgi:hypothetical protein
MITLPYWPDWSVWCAAIGLLLVLLLFVFLIRKRFSPTMFVLGIVGFLMLFASYLDLTGSITYLR